MNGLMTASKMAEKLGVPQSTFSDWIRNGRVPGVVKVSNVWLVPDTVTINDIDKPAMGRPKTEKANGHNDH